MMRRFAWGNIKSKDATSRKDAYRFQKRSEIGLSEDAYPKKPAYTKHLSSYLVVSRVECDADIEETLKKDWNHLLKDQHLHPKYGVDKPSVGSFNSQGYGVLDCTNLYRAKQKDQ